MLNKTKIVISAIVLLLIIAGVGAYFLFKESKNIPASETNIEELRKELESVYNKNMRSAVSVSTRSTNGFKKLSNILTWKSWRNEYEIPLRHLSRIVASPKRL